MRIGERFRRMLTARRCVLGVSMTVASVRRAKPGRSLSSITCYVYLLYIGERTFRRADVMAKLSLALSEQRHARRCTEKKREIQFRDATR